MVQKRILAIIIVAVAVVTVSGSSTSFSPTFNITIWKINEFYLDSNRIFNPTLDSFSYQFKENGEYIYSYGRNSFDSTYWTWNELEKKILINGPELKDTLYVVYEDESNLVLRQRKRNSISNTFSWIESRLVPK